jgi:hypothetical protein
MAHDAPYVAFWDIETAERIDQMTGRFREDKVKKLTISCASVLTVPSELCLDPADAERAIELSTMRTFWVDGAGPTSIAAMVELLEGAELTAGYNVAGFDWPIMQKYMGADAFDRCRARSHDLFSRVRDATAIWFKLDKLLAANGLETKTADGLVAIRWWAEGNREDLQHYCECDVRQLARLALLPVLDPGDGRRLLPNCVHGVASALAAVRASDALAADATRPATCSPSEEAR